MKDLVSYAKNMHFVSDLATVRKISISQETDSL